MTSMNADLLRYIRPSDERYFLKEDWFHTQLAAHRASGIQGVPETFNDENDVDAVTHFAELLFSNSLPNDPSKREPSCVLSGHRLQKAPSWEDLRKISDEALRASSDFKATAVDDYKAPRRQWSTEVAHYALFRWSGDEPWPRPMHLAGKDYLLIRIFWVHYRAGDSWANHQARSAAEEAKRKSEKPKPKFDYRC